MGKTMMLVVGAVVTFVVGLSVQTGVAWAGGYRGQPGVWSAQGSLAAQQIADANRVLVEGTLIKFKENKTGTMHLHYAPIERYRWAGMGGAEVKVHFRDNGESARVRLFLHVIDVNDAKERVFLVFDSDNYGSSSKSRTKAASLCFEDYPSTQDNIFWIAAELWKTSTAGNPELHWIHMVETPCI